MAKYRLQDSVPVQILSRPTGGFFQSMKMTKDEYNKYVMSKSPASPLFRNLLLAFLVGGAICCIGQGLLALYGYFGLSELDAATATSVTLVFLGALLTGLGVYDDLAKFAGAGSLVPITGFANSVASPALEFKTEGIITGMAAKEFIIAGPVIVFGLSTSVIYGLLLVLLGV
jgi:stage V sporulation protein AC